MAGFFALPRSVFHRTTQWDPIGYKIGLEILVKTGCRRVHEVPIHFADRRRGQSKLSWREQWNYLRHLWRLAGFKFGGYWHFILYSLVGASGAIVDLSSLAAMLRFQVPLPAARGLAILAALVWNFLGNEHLTFRQTARGRGRRFVQFTLACGMGATLNYLTTMLGTSISPTLAAHPLVAALLGIAVATAFNFLLARGWVFTSHHQSDGSV
jgi:dolichol-phosphate mannosyltransferase